MIGGGPAGVTAALRARELGATVTLIERDRLGGTCTNDGCVPVRVLARAARLLRDADQFPTYGIEGSGPRLHFAATQRRVRAIIEEIHDKKQLRGNLQRSGVRLYEGAGDASFVDSHTVALEDGTRISADRFILCAGGSPRLPSFPGAEWVQTPLNLWEWSELPRSITIVGAAATGCQLASIMEAFGVGATLLDTAPNILPGEDSAVSEAICSAFQQRGIRIRTGIGAVERVESVGEGTNTLRVHFSEQDGPQSVESEAVLFSIGWPGNLSGLNLEAAGVSLKGDYVEVDGALRTTTPHIFAAGDITGLSMLVPSANAEARRAAENAVQDRARAMEHSVVPHGGFTDPEYAGVGLTEREAQEQDRSVVSITVPLKELDRAIIDSHTEGFCKLVVSPAEQTVVGAHMVGEQALEVIQAVAVGMAAGIRIDRLAEMEFAYPTLTAVLGVCGRSLREKMHPVEAADTGDESTETPLPPLIT